MSSPAPHCMIATPADTPPALLRDALIEAAAAPDVAAVLLIRAGNDPIALAALADAVLKPLQKLDKAVILRGPAELAVRLGADGAELTMVDDLAAARRILGTRSLGVRCGLSRHAAMEAGEADADYVAFGPISTPEDAEIIAWWAALMNVACVAVDVDAEAMEAVRAAGPEFVQAMLITQ